MNFSPHPNKQAQEILFSRKKTASVVYFNNKPVKLSQIHNHLGLLRKFQLMLPRHSLITIYKSFVTPHLDYSDVIYVRASHFINALNPSNIMLL